MPSSSASSAAHRPDASDPPRPGRRPSGSARPHAARFAATLALAKAEARLLLREPGTLIYGLAFPALLISLLGKLFPGFEDPNPDLGGRTTVEVYVPVVLALSLCTVALLSMPVTLANYRHNGVLRRLSTTPLPRSRLLLVQLVLQLALAIAAAGLALASVAALFGLSSSLNVPAFAASFVLSGIALFTVGLLITALARSGQVANAVGMATYFPMLFFAGVWIPRDAMTDTLQTLSDFTPSGAAAQALQDAWFGEWPDPLSVLVLLAWFLLVGAVAAKLFRWE